jgi:hypothetical protein
MPHHHPHDPPTPPEGFRALRALRLRFWVSGRLRDEVWIDAADPEAGGLAEFVGAYHVKLSEMADAAGVPWMTEVFDPEEPADSAYLRFGTDPAGITEPRPMNGGGL